jgi:hypothetical protein
MFTRYNLTPSFVFCLFNKPSDVLCKFILKSIESVVLGILACDGF